MTPRRRKPGKDDPAMPAEESSQCPAPETEATEQDRRAMALALALARRAAELKEVPVGAVVYETASGRVIGEGFNQRETLHDPAAHAEFLAIREACFTLGDWRLSACTLVVTLEPCCMCAGLIVNARVGRVVYACADPKAGAAESLMQLTMDARLNHRVRPIAGVMAEDSAALLKEFFRQLRGRGD